MDQDEIELLDARGQIKRDKIEDLLVEVASGKCIFAATADPSQLYASRTPTSYEQDKGRILYARRIHEGRLKNLKTIQEMEELAIRTGQFSLSEREEKKNLTELLQRHTKAREGSTDAGYKLQLDHDIMKGRRRLEAIHMNEWDILKHALENRAEDVRASFFVSCCTLMGELLDIPVWESWDDFQAAQDLSFLLDAKRAYMRVSAGLSIKIIRAIARTAEWRVRWKSAKESGSPPFDGQTGSWDRNKLNLIYWSDFYDNVYSHPDSPADDVVQNDEYLQGWINGVVAKRKKHQVATSGPTVKRNGKAMTKVGETRRVINTPVKRRV